jgi:hypothetical protein
MLGDEVEHAVRADRATSGSNSSSGRRAEIR